MEADWDLVVTIAMPLLALIVGAFLDRHLESRAKLVAFIGHVSAHALKQDDGSTNHVYTHAVIIRNNGRKPAENVRLSHRTLPNFNVYPDVDHQVNELPLGDQEILIPTLVPGEQLTISYLYFPPTTWNEINGTIKSDAGLVNVIDVIPTRQFPQWVNRVILALLTIGIIATLYFLVLFARHVFQIVAV